MSFLKSRRARRLLAAFTVVAAVVASLVAGGAARAANSVPTTYGAAGPDPVPALGTNATSVTRFNQTLSDMGRTTVAWNTNYMSDTAQVDTALLDLAAARGVRHFVVTLEIHHALREIIAGDADTNLHRISRVLATWQQNHPNTKLTVRHLHEANADWYDWGFKDGHNGNRMSEFIPAWQHVWTVMKSDFPSLTFYWCPNGLFAGQTSYAGFYPGDAYVNYVGHDKYNRSQSEGGVSWNDPNAVHEPSIKAVRAVAPTKPYVIGETSTSEPSTGARLLGHSKATWFTEFGSWIRQVATRYGVVAVCIFDYNKESENGNDWRVYPTGKPDAVKSRDAFRKATAGL